MEVNRRNFASKYNTGNRNRAEYSRLEQGRKYKTGIRPKNHHDWNKDEKSSHKYLRSCSYMLCFIRVNINLDLFFCLRVLIIMIDYKQNIVYE